jgi:hypothetical protein
MARPRSIAASVRRTCDPAWTTVLKAKAIIVRRMDKGFMASMNLMTLIRLAAVKRSGNFHYRA